MSEKLRAKIPATTPSCPMAKIGNLDDFFRLRSFLNPESKPSGRSITAAKKKKKMEEKERGKNSKIEKPKDVGHLLVQKLKILISAHG